MHTPRSLAFGLPRLLMVASIAAVLLAILPLTAIQPNPVQAGPEAAVFSRTWLWFDEENAQMPSLVIDSRGGRHVVFNTLLANSQSIYPAYYGYCASGCTNPAHWSYVSLGDMGFLGDGLSISLTPAGQPRVMWGYYNMSGDNKYYYAECNGNCGQPGSWTVGFLKEAYSYSDTQSYFAIDPQGVSHFIYDETYSTDGLHDGTFYASCIKDCTSWDSWSEGRLDTAVISTVNLKFDSNNRPRIIYYPSSKYSYEDTTLIYAECNSACSNGDNWNGVPVLSVTSESRDQEYFDLEITSTGKPRIATYANDQLSYLWCNTGCADSASNWTVYDMGFPADYGTYVEMELDSNNRPRLAYEVFVGGNDDDGMTYAVCSAGCETSNPTWTHELVETSDDLDLSDPGTTPTGCQYSTWTDVGRNPAFALDSANNPHFAYEARYSAICNGSVNLVIMGVRYAASGEVTPPTATPTRTSAPTKTPTHTPTGQPPVFDNICYLPVIIRSTK